MKTIENDRRSERGLALVSVLWTLSILSLIAASMMAAGNLSYRMERTSLRQTLKDEIVETAVNRAVLGLIDTRPDKRWRVDGVARAIDIGETHGMASIQDELGLIDINETDTSLLKGLFQSAGLSPEQATVMADHVIDWRIAGDLHSLEGAGKPDYQDTGYRPRGGPFQSIDELKLVLGMTQDLFSRVAPAITIYSGRPNFDPNLAPREALLALPNSDASDVNDILRKRSSGAGTPNAQGFVVGGGVIDPSLPLVGRAFRIVVEMPYGNRQAKTTAVIRLTGDQARPYMTLAWE